MAQMTEDNQHEVLRLTITLAMKGGLFLVEL